AILTFRRKHAMENATQFTRANVSEKLTSKRQFMLLGLLVLIVFLSLMEVVPPAAVPANAPTAHFSSARAMTHLHEIAQAPHPTGSAENARVRAYLVEQLRALGLQPEVQQTASVNHQALLSTVA